MTYDPVWYWLQVGSWVFQIITALLTVLLLFLSLKATYRLKTADVRMEHQRRFDRLLETKNDLRFNATATKAHVYAHCERFWNLQTDQFSDWRDGYLSDRTFRLWLEHRLYEWSLNAEIAAGVTFQQGWAEVKKNFKHTDFTDFMTIVFERNDGINRAIEEYRPHAWKRFMAWVLG